MGYDLWFTQGDGQIEPKEEREREAEEMEGGRVRVLAPHLSSPPLFVLASSCRVVCEQALQAVVCTTCALSSIFVSEAQITPVVSYPLPSLTCASPFSPTLSSP